MPRNPGNILGQVLASGLRAPNPAATIRASGGPRPIPTPQVGQAGPGIGAAVPGISGAIDDIFRGRERREDREFSRERDTAQMDFQRGEAALERAARDRSEKARLEQDESQFGRGLTAQKEAQDADRRQQKEMADLGFKVSMTMGVMNSLSNSASSAEIARAGQNAQEADNLMKLISDPTASEEARAVAEQRLTQVLQDWNENDGVLTYGQLFDIDKTARRIGGMNVGLDGADITVADIANETDPVAKKALIKASQFGEPVTNGQARGVLSGLLASKGFDLGLLDTARIDGQAMQKLDQMTKLIATKARARSAPAKELLRMMGYDGDVPDVTGEGRGTPFGVGGSTFILPGENNIPASGGGWQRMDDSFQGVVEKLVETRKKSGGSGIMWVNKPKGAESAPVRVSDFMEAVGVPSDSMIGALYGTGASGDLNAFGTEKNPEVFWAVGTGANAAQRVINGWFEPHGGGVDAEGGKTIPAQSKFDTMTEGLDDAQKRELKTQLRGIARDFGKVNLAVRSTDAFKSSPMVRSMENLLTRLSAQPDIRGQEKLDLVSDAMSPYFGPEAARKLQEENANSLEIKLLMQGGGDITQWLKPEYRNLGKAWISDRAASMNQIKTRPDTQAPRIDVMSAFQAAQPGGMSGGGMQQPGAGELGGPSVPPNPRLPNDDSEYGREPAMAGGGG